MGLSGSQGRFPLLDGVRALAATFVFLFHGWYFLGMEEGRALSGTVNEIGVQATRDLSTIASHLGEIGVALFYLLSAFLLYRPFAKHALADGRPVELKAYFVRRLARIVPAYWLVITVVGIADPQTNVFSIDGLLNLYLFLGIWNPEGIVRASNPFIATWTVQVEMTFYLFLPVWAGLMAWVRRRGRDALRTELWGLAVLAGVGIAWKLVAVGQISGEAWFGSSFAVLPASIDVFAVGMALAIASVLGGSRWSVILGRIGGRSLACWTGAAATYLLLCWVGDPRGPFGGTTAANALGSNFLKIPVALLILLPAIRASGGSDAIARFLGWRAVAWIGTVSYGVYLWHVWVLRHLGGTWIGGGNGPFNTTVVQMIVPEMIAAYAITLMIAAASWYLLEQRTLAAGHRLSKRIETRGATGSTAA